MIELKRYKLNNKVEWDKFLDSSRIDTFLFKRDFMDYHADRFQDCSFIIYRKNKLEALMPGNISGTTWHSHQGLTYGGLINSLKISTNDVLEIFEHLNEYLKSIDITEVIIKPVPHIYHKYPSEEELYALFRNGAQRNSCNISSTIFQKNKISFIESRKSGIRKSAREGISIIEAKYFESFWLLLEENLEKTHGRKPVHTFKEIQQLKKLFPENIRLFCTVFKKRVIGGALLFIMKRIVHVQYISANDEGKSLGALDLLFHELINIHFADYPIFDFGQSTEENGNYLNEGLIFQKEGFGGRGIVYETYKYKIS
jgi:hypothetical protein